MQVTYTTLIDGCVRTSKAETGRELFAEMLANGVQPNVVTYNTLLRACAADSQADLQVCAVQAFKEVHTWQILVFGICSIPHSSSSVLVPPSIALHCLSGHLVPCLLFESWLLGVDAASHARAKVMQDVQSGYATTEPLSAALESLTCNGNTCFTLGY